MNVIMDGRKQQGNATIKQNKTKQKQNKTKAKLPTSMGRSNDRSPHPAHCHMGRVNIQSKII